MAQESSFPSICLIIFLSKPAEYPMPAFYLFAIQRITESLEPARCLAEAGEGDQQGRGAPVGAGQAG